MKYKDYSPEIWDRINEVLDQVLVHDKEPVAAFDADGTLWDMDLGELFFHYQIDNKLVALPEHAFNHYEDLKKEDPRKAYLWLAQICQGKPLSQVHAWAQEALKAAFPVPVLLEQKKIIDLFLSKGVKIYIITASIKWAVEPGAELLGLNKSAVLGVVTKVHDGVVTSEQDGVITYKGGKVDALLEATQGKRPFFASGNTMGDFELLSSATHLALAVSAASRDDRIFKTELELQGHAEKNQWLSHRFI